MEHVPYRTIAQIATDVMGGDIAVSITGLGSLGGFVRDGRIRVLAWTGERRFEGLPDVPTVIEQSVPEFTMSIKARLFAHKATPPDLPSSLAMSATPRARPTS